MHFLVPLKILACLAHVCAGGAFAQSEAPTQRVEHWEPFPVLPMVWWNDVSDLTVGVWVNSGSTQLGTFTFALARGIDGRETATLGETVDFFARVSDPPFLRLAGFRGAVSGWALDGTAGSSLRLSRHADGGTGQVETGGSLEWVATRETRFLDPALWDNAGTVEAALFHDRSWSAGFGEVNLRIEAGGGAAYRLRGRAQPGGRYVTTPFGRLSGEVSVKRRIGLLTAGARAFAAGVLSGDPVPMQRRVGLKGADPYRTLGNPWVRTEGAPLVNRDVFYHSPGNANLRGYRSDLAGRWAAAVNLEAEADLFRRERGPVQRVSLVAFWDGGVVDTLAVRSLIGRAYRFVVDAGAGARIRAQVGKLRFPIRVEFPLYVSEPILADDRRQGIDSVEFRWLISLQPIF